MKSRNLIFKSIEYRSISQHHIATLNPCIEGHYIFTLGSNLIYYMCGNLCLIIYQTRMLAKIDNEPRLPLSVQHALVYSGIIKWFLPQKLYVNLDYFKSGTIRKFYGFSY